MTTHRCCAAQEVLLAELPGETEDQRLLLVHRHTPGGASELQLRQQSWAERIGWYTQSTVQLSAAQVQALRLALGHTPTQGGSTVRPASRPAGFVPRVVRADSA